MKPVLSLLLTVSITVFGLVALAHAAVIQVTSNSHADSFPQVKGDYLVWQGYVDGDWEIFLYDAATGQTTQITDNDFDDLSPQTDGSYIVWQGFYEDEWDVFLWDGIEVQLISGVSAEDVSPQIANGFVVWTSSPFGEGFIGPGEVILHDASNGTYDVLSESVDPGNSFHDGRPRINDEVVIWVQVDGEGNETSYMYEFETGSVSEITEGFVWRDSPQRDGGLTVLSRHNGGDRDIFVYDTVSRTYYQLTDDDSQDRYPSISGCYVAWVAGGEIFLAKQVILTAAAAGVRQRRFTADWNAPARGVDSYLLDVSTDRDFTQWVAGYQAKAVPGTSTSINVTGLSPLTTYYYRVRPVIGGTISGDSNIAKVITATRGKISPALFLLLVFDEDPQSPVIITR